MNWYRKKYPSLDIKYSQADSNFFKCQYLQETDAQKRIF